MWGTLGEPSAQTSARLNLRIDAGLTTLRHATYVAGAQVPLHRHDVSSIVYGAGGPCVETTATTERINRRRLTYLPAGYRHALDYAGPTQVFVAEAHPALANKLNLWAFDTPVMLPASFYNDVWDVLVELRPAVDEAQLSESVGKLWTRSAQYLHARTPEWLQPLIEQLHEEWESQPSAAALARHLGFSPQYLCRVFKRTVGMTLKQYNQAIRLDYARALLWGSGMGITEVANVTGFSDQSHLTRILRQYSGETPRTLRARSFAPAVPLRHSYGSS